MRALRIAGAVVLVLLAVVALAVGGALTLAQTRWGGDVVRRVALPRINEAIAGELELDRIQLRIRGLGLERVVLRDPEGVVVARIERVDVAWNPFALRHRRVDVSSFQIDRPELWIVQDGDGTNLARALAPAKPGSAKPPSKSSRDGPGWTIDLSALSLHDGLVDFRSLADGEPARHIRLPDLRVQAAMHYETASSAMSGNVDVGFAGGGLVAQIESSGGSDRDTVRLRLDRLAVPARVVRAFLPAFKSDVTARADVRKRGDVVAVEVAIAASGARLDARGDIDVVGLRAVGDGLKVRGSNINLSRLIADAPASDLGFALTARGGGRDFASADGSVDFELPPSRLDGHTLGPIRFKARAEGGRYTVADLLAKIPGIQVTGNAAAGRTAIEAHLRVEAKDLAATARSLAPPRGPPPIDIAGNGRVDVALGGTVKVPSLRIAGRIPKLRIGATRLDGLTISATASAARIALSAKTKSPYPIEVEVAGRRSPTSATIDALRIQYPEAAWSLSKPARVRFGGDRLAIEGLALRAGDQEIDVDVVQAAKRVHGRVVISALALDKLPRILLPQPRSVAGAVDVDATFDSSLARPKLSVDAAAHRLVIDRQTVGEVTLSARGEGDQPSKVELQVKSPLPGSSPAETHVAIETPLSLRSVLRRPPTTAALMHTRFDVRADVGRLPLAPLGRLVGYRLPVGGTVSSQMSLAGTAVDPKGSIAVDVSGATTGKFPPTDARVEVDLDRSSTAARVRVTRKGHPLLALESRLGAGVLALGSPEALSVAPLRVRAVFGPLGLARLGLPPDSERAPPRELKGQFHADLAVDGNLRAPRVLMHVHVADIRLDKVLVGYGQIEARYGNRAAEVDARLVSANGGSLHAVARTTADLGYPTIVTTGIDVPRLPLDVRLEAQGFDVQGLSGVTQSLRTVGGLLTASAAVRGTVADPRVSGKLEWKDGVVAVTGFGEYKNIHLALQGDQQKLVLDELRAQSGAGSARVTGDATHVQGTGYQFSAKADVNKFPVYQEGQAVAQLSLEAALSGSVSPLKSRAKIEIQEARVELSDAKRKQLQSLKVPADIVLVDDGKPLNRAQAERLRALLAAREARAKADGDDDAAREARAAAPAVEPPVSKVFVKVDAPRRLWVTGKDAYMELGLGPNFRVSMTDKTRVFGQVIVHRGRINVFGRRFDIKSESTLQFNGPTDRPELDVSAQYRNDTEDVTVLLTAKGPLDRLTIAVTSPNRPELNESQLYTLIITGHLQLGGGTSGASSPSAQAASLLGGMLASKLQKTLAGKLPLDVLTIDAGGAGLAGTQLEAGRYVTDKLYVGYVGRVGADPNRHQNRNAVHLEYQLSTRWGIDGEYGDVGTGTADLMWKKNY